MPTDRPMHAAARAMWEAKIVPLAARRARGFGEPSRLEAARRGLEAEAAAARRLLFVLGEPGSEQRERLAARVAASLADAGKGRPSLN